MFDGLAQTSAGYASLIKIAQRVEALLEDTVKTFIVVASSDKPANLNWDGNILLDAERELHQLYGAGAQALYLIRPDGYISFRSQPVEESHFLRYLDQIFLLKDA